MEFLLALSESAVTFTPDAERYGWAVADETGPTPAWEAISPFGEIKCFDNRADAHAWRISQVREYAAYLAS